MAVYYIDPCGGDNTCDGLSAERARRDYTDLDIKGGDSVLFKRGSFLREMLKNKCGDAGNPVTYGAYGEGEKPVFCGSVDIGQSDMWQRIEGNIWKYLGHIPTEASNMIYDGGASYGTFRWSREELVGQGDWYDNRSGTTYPTAKRYCEFCDTGEAGELLMYSERNPAEYYSSIECAPFMNGRLAAAERDTVFCDLAFINGGVHGICGSGIRISVIGCEFRNIGGAVIMKDKKIRFGNGVEFWEICEDCSVTDCSFDNIYDSAITHQGKINKNLPKNNTFDRNIFHRCGMAAYECRDFIPANTSFSDNVCDTAGEGFSALGEVMPRSSEIWPMPMGHHVFIWRIRNRTDGSSLRMKNNRFLSARYGGAIFSLGVKEMYADFDVDNNAYLESEMLLCAYLSDSEYKTLAEFKANTDAEKNGYVIK